MRVLFAILALLSHGTLAEVREDDLNELAEQQNSVIINKCCEPQELMVDKSCKLAEDYNQSMYLCHAFVSSE